MLASLEDSVVVVIDMQPSFLDGCWRGPEVLGRVKFLVESANLLGVPVLATEQYRDRMGGTEPGLAALIGQEALDKLSFSCCGTASFSESLSSLGRRQVVLTGIETHICVNQTAHHLVEAGDREVVVCVDAVTARSEDRHRIGMERIRALRCTPAHTESVVYEWLGSATHPQFRDALRLVKQYAP
jgi:nicotinamidase-related amidase